MGEFYFGDVPPFKVDAVGVSSYGFFRGEAFDFQDISISEKLCIAASVGIGRFRFVGDPFGEKEISQLVPDPTFGMAEADLEGLGVLLLR